jgi:hypothetical protein
MKNQRKIDERFESQIDLNSAPSKTDDLRDTQTKRLLTAYEKIASAELREELVLLMQIISEKPELLARRSQSFAVPSKFLQ